MLATLGCAFSWPETVIELAQQLEQAGRLAEAASRTHSGPRVAPAIFTVNDSWGRFPGTAVLRRTGVNTSASGVWTTARSWAGLTEAGQKVVAPSASASSIRDFSGSARSVAWRAFMPRTRRARSELSWPGERESEGEELAVAGA